MAKEPRIVEVQWEDAWSTSDVTPFRDPELNEQIVRRSVGWLLKTRPNILLCASPYVGFERGQDFTSIPRSLVKKIRELKPVKDA